MLGGICIKRVESRRDTTIKRNRLPYLRIVFGESHATLEETAFIQSIRRTDNHDFPFVNVLIVDQTGAESLNRVLGQL